jgi:ABC-type nitrate/sulfonate/bicarbonate transport system substrate-binding protein
MAVMDIHELALARARGEDLVGVLGIVARPVAALRPKQLRAATQRTPGAPEYPELLLVAPRATITDDRASVRGAVAALQRGYGEAYVDPDAATQALVTAVPRLRTPAVSAALDRLGPDFQGTLRTFGELDPARLRAWAAWEPRTGLVKRPLDAARAFDGEFVTNGG